MKKDWNESGGKTWKAALAGAAVMLSLVLMARMYNQSNLVTSFPMGYTNDVSSYVAQLHFLDVCGYHHDCPYWYNGFVNFAINQPGWSFFSFPLLLVLNDPAAATYASMILMVVLSLVVTLWFASRQGWPKMYGWAFFALFFANALSIGTFLRLGRVPAFLSFIIIIAFFTLILEYKKNRRMISLVGAGVMYALLIITHYQEAILASLLYISLFLSVFSWKERLFVVASFGAGLVLSSWWWLGFVQAIPSANILSMKEGGVLIDLSTSASPPILLLMFVVPLIFLGLFSFARRHPLFDKPMQIFFLPFLLLAVVYATRLTVFIPVLNNIAPAPYIMFFAMLSLYILFATYPSAFPVYLRKAVPPMMMAVVLSSVFFSLFLTSWLPDERTPVDEDIISLLPYVEGNFLLMRGEDRSFTFSYSKPHYAYASIYHNITTPDGWYPALAPGEHLKTLDELYKSFEWGNCVVFLDLARKKEATHFISDPSGCRQLAACGLMLVKDAPHSCLYTVNER